MNKLLTFALVPFFLASLSTTAMADDDKPATISVSATGSATVAPDMAVLQLSVQREGKTAREALTANNQAMTGVLAAMKDEGIEDRDLQTSNFNIQPRYVYPKPSKNEQPKPPEIVGYIVSNSLTVRVRKLDGLGEILDKSVSLGVNSGGNVMFTSENSEPIIEMARKNAMAKAIAKAKTLTEAAGVQLGNIMQISEQNRGRPRPRAMARMASADMESAKVPIASGENSYSVTVNVSWELDQ